MKELKAFVDRIEDGMAVLLIGDQCRKCVIPYDQLPPGVREGTVLRLSFEIDAEASEQARRDAADQIDRLKHRDI